MPSNFPSKSPTFSKTAVFILIAAMSAAQVVVHDWFVDSRVRGVQKALHEQVISASAPAPIQYRVFVHYAAEGLMRSGLDFQTAFTAIRFVFTMLAGWFFFTFLTKWFAREAAVIGVLWLFALLPFTYIRYYFQPMDIPNLFFFVVGMYAAASGRYAAFLAVLGVAMFNRETAILLVPIWLFARWGRRKNTAVIVETAVAGALGIGIYALLRRTFAIKAYYSDLFYLGSNLSDLRTYIYALIFFGPFVFYAFRDFRSKPLFMRRAALVIPFFAIIHFTMTIMIEPRLWLPILPVFIPLGLWSLTPETLRKSISAADDNPAVSAGDSAVKGRGAALYLAALAAFVVFFAGFFQWYQKAHLGNRRDYELSENIFAEASRLSAGGWDEAAVEQLTRGAAIFPANAEFHYRLALACAYRIFDEKRALEHFRKVLELDPHHLDRDRVKAEISRIEYYSKPQNGRR
ncbi:MAG: hypothetical protein CVU77_05835 [Elusimicrobia bacterium HGW-Elusimicrobia-1]|jgi:tetratricopeptide (TPR) repeat protein|nr:MAG: hypothetical protein CVU77_05835 [Elusimicrobia bacterium HGW-Elusimicrobia-1]